MLLSIIIPVYNELATLEEIIHRVKQVPLSSLEREIIVVDDGSTDGTRELLGSLQDAQVKVVLQPRNRGKGAAVRAGFEHAMGDILLIQDADLEYDPADYPTLLQPILDGKADVVFGSRFLGNTRRVLYFWHSVMNHALTTFSNMSTNLNLTDMETCYKVFRREVIEGITLNSERFGIEPELTAKVARRGWRIYEVPISYHGRTYAEGKKITWKDGLEAIWAITKYNFIESVPAREIGAETLFRLQKLDPYNRWLYERLSPFLGQRVLEIGAGIGNITRYLLSRERVIAADVDPFYLDTLSRMFSHRKQLRVAKVELPLSQELLDDLRAEQLDTIVCMNVLEHIERDDDALRSLYEALAPGGRLLLLVPAHMRLYGTLDKELGHFRRYEQRALEQQIERAGFVVQASRYLNRIGALGWFATGRILRKRVIPNSQLKVFSLLSPFLSREETHPPGFGLSVFVVAQKNAR